MSNYHFLWHVYFLCVNLCLIHSNRQDKFEKEFNFWKRRWLQAGSLSAGSGAAERIYPTSEVRGSGREYQAATEQERLRGATVRPRSGAAAERSYPVSQVRGGREETPGVRDRVGQEKPPHAQGQGW